MIGPSHSRHHLFHLLLVATVLTLTAAFSRPFKTSFIPTSKRPPSLSTILKTNTLPRPKGPSLGRAARRAVKFTRTTNSSFPTARGDFAPPPPTNTWVRVGALITVFAADKKTFLTVPGECTGHPDAWFKEKTIYTLGMGGNGPTTLCSGSNPNGNLFVIIAEQTIGASIYSCTSMTSKTGCERASFWWSVWYKWNSDLNKMGITADDIRYNRWVLMSAAEYAHMVRLFWRAAHDNDLPSEATTIHSIHGHYIPKVPLRVPLVSRGGGAFGSPIWHGTSDPCVYDAMQILFHSKNIIARPCTPMTYDGSGFYISSPDKLSSTVLFNCDHTCGFRYYYGTATRGQIIAYNSWKKDLNNQNQIAGAILDGY